MYLAFATPQPKYLKNPNLGLRVLEFQNENFWNSTRILEFLGQNLEFLGKILEFLRIKSRIPSIKSRIPSMKKDKNDI